MADDPVPFPHDRIRRMMRQFERLPPNDRRTFDAIAAMLLALSAVPRKHRGKVVDLMRAFVEVPKEHQMLVLRLAVEDIRDEEMPPATRRRMNRRD